MFADGIPDPPIVFSTISASIEAPLTITEHTPSPTALPHQSPSLPIATPTRLPEGTVVLSGGNSDSNIPLDKRPSSDRDSGWIGEIMQDFHPPSAEMDSGSRNSMLYS